MSFHPAFPTAADLSREAAAITRDRTDLATLTELRTIVSAALNRASRCDAIRHPDRRFQTDDLLDALHGALADIDDEAQRIRTGTPRATSSSRLPAVGLSLRNRDVHHQLTYRLH
jgi:hypothetical protein